MSEGGAHRADSGVGMPELDYSLFIDRKPTEVRFEDMAPVFFVDDRPGWDEYFLGIAEAVSKRGDCTRSQVGAVLVRSDHTVAGIGYNGTYAGRPGCLLGACPRGRKSYAEMAAYSGDYSDCIATHAEHNAILNGDPADLGITAYVTRQPCEDCGSLLVQRGITRIVWPDGSWNQ